MAKQIVWSAKAKKERVKILNYWIKRNKSNTYSIKLNDIFTKSVAVIAVFPKIGKFTKDKKSRIKIVKEYLIIYEETEKSIRILTVWDSRQDPEKIVSIKNLKTTNR